MSVELALVLALGIPTAGALAVALLHRRPNLREGATLTTGALLFLNVLYLARETGGGRSAIDVEWIEVLPGLPLAFSVEPLGLLFALIASGLWIVTSLYSIGYMRAHDEKSQTRFTSVSRSPSPRRWGSRLRATCSRCSCSTKS